MNAVPAAAPSISRRRIVQGAAWATPAVLIATAAPALAVSPNSSVTITSMTFTQSGNSNNFYLDMTGTPVGLVTGDAITVTVVFNVGAANVTVSSNSSGFALVSNTKSGTTQTTVAQFPYDGSGVVGIAKLKFTIAIPGPVVGQVASVTFSSGGYTLVSQNVTITK